MKITKLRFISNNKYKIQETTELFKPHGIEVIAVGSKLEELQTTNIHALVRDKTLRAFNQIGHPLVVEHTGLVLDALGGFPGGLTQIFWDAIQADRFSSLFGGTKISAKTTIGFCDGQKIHFVDGETNGQVAASPKGPREFQWDCIFIPEGYSKTFAEMGAKKNEISMRRKAIDSFVEYLKGI